MENWNDDRLDELSRRMDNGFAKVDREMKEGFARVDRELKEGFAQVNDRLERQNHTLLVAACGVIAALIANGIFG